MSERHCKVEVFSRVTGFYRPVQSWNEGKTEEFKDRKRYNIEPAVQENDNCRVSEALAG